MQALDICPLIQKGSYLLPIFCAKLTDQLCKFLILFGVPISLGIDTIDDEGLGLKVPWRIFLELILNARWGIGFPGGYSFFLVAHRVSMVFQWLRPLFYLNSMPIELLVLLRFPFLILKSAAILAYFRNLTHIGSNIWWCLVLKLDLRLVASQSIKLACIVGMWSLVFRKKSLSGHDGLDKLRSSFWLSVGVFRWWFIATQGRRARKTWRSSHFCVHLLIR